MVNVLTVALASITLLPLGDGADARLRLATDDLRTYLGKMGAEATDVVLGDASVKPASASSEAFRLVVSNGVVKIGGNTPAGVAYGIYRFLREAGCDWVMPGPEGEVVPSRPNLPLAEGFDIEEEPSYSSRYGWFVCRDKRLNEMLSRWCLRLGGQVALDPDFHPEGHVWGTIIKENQTAFDSDPTLYALQRNKDGTVSRGGCQFEETDPRIIEMSVEHIRREFRKNRWANDRAVCLPMGPSDGGALSLSEASRRVASGRFDSESSRQDGTDNVIRYLNALLARTKDEFPNLKLGFYLYSWHGGFPVREVPDPRIVPVIADINFSRFHGIGDETSKTRFHYEDIVRKWAALSAKQGNELVYRPYSWNLAEGWMPYSKITAWSREIQLFHSLGVRHFRANYTLGWNVNAPHSYLAMRLAWNAAQDGLKVFDDFCRAAYGKASGPMKDYHLAIDARQREAGQEAGAFWAFSLIYDVEFVRKMERLLDRADALADTTADKRRVEMFGREPLGHLKRYLAFRDHLAEYDFAAAGAEWNRAIDESEAEGKKNELNVPRWGRQAVFRGFRDFCARAVRCSTGDYRIVARIPDRLKTAIDREGNGEELGFFRPHVNDRNWLETKTWSSTWDAQGLSAYRTGFVWYRAHVRVPKSEAAWRGLFVGDVDTVVRVWINGTFVGQGGPVSQRTPYVFDATEVLRSGEENLIALEIERRGNFEIGTGGILLPCFLFEGPESPGPSSAERPYEILPGGAIRYLDETQTTKSNKEKRS